jgi:hypothetical protein
MSQEIVLREEEIFDVTLASFYVFDKERAGAFRAGAHLIRVSGCCEFACLAGPATENNAYSAASENNAYSPPVPRPIRPAHRPVRKRR